jgi:long-chain fatty acid transport protein
MRNIDKRKSSVLREGVKMSVVLAMSAAYLQASGYKIPEQSLSGLALGAANVAAVDGADASYYNPANMAFLSNPKSELELLLTYVNLPHMTYNDSNDASINGNSEVERFVAPLMHFVIPQHYDKWRFGFSAIVPGGLAKRWYSPYQAASSKKFSLKIIEANPTAAYKITDWASIGFGARAVYSTGSVQTYAKDSRTYNMEASMDMEGDSFDFGYNLALSVRPVESLKLAATYRSKVDLTLKGDADLKYPVQPNYDGKASVTIPLPAVLDIAAAYTFNKKTTLEFVYEKVFWSAYKNLNFDFGAGAPSAFESSKPKNWKNSDTYRIGFSHWMNDDLKLMMGFTIDKSPTPNESIGFELPDADSKNYSGGFEYSVNEDLSIGAAYLYSRKEERKALNNANPLTKLDGDIGHGGAHLMNLSFKYRF